MATAPSDIPIEAILKDSEFDVSKLQRVSFRKIKAPIHLVEPDPSWPALFDVLSQTIKSALGLTALDVRHVGSTSVPALPAKPVIDIDLVVQDNTDEASYVPQLEAAGFQFLTREPHWHEHRFFCSLEPLPPCNLHIWSPNCPEVERHRVFREWLLKSEEDRELYIRAKREASRITQEEGGLTMDYNKRKENLIRQILRRALKDAGYLD